MSDSDVPPVAGDPPRDAGTSARAERQIVRLRRAIRERDQRLYELQARLAALESSTSYQLARAVAGVGKQKARGAVQLPRQLYRLWKQRSAPQNAATLRDRPPLEGFDRAADRLLVADPYDGLIVAGVLAEATASALQDHARVIRLYPHAAAPVLDAADVDMLIVDAAAGAPGGPWAYLGVPGMYDRERTLLDLREVARARGLPLVLWGAAPATLTRLDWDAVVAGSPTAASVPDELAALAARFEIPITR